MSASTKDYSLLAVSKDAIMQHLDFGHWVPLGEAIDTMKGLIPNVVGIIDPATDKVIWKA